MPEIFNLWVEFEKGDTKEAQIVKKIDKLDAVMQSKIYSEENNNEKLFDEFYTFSIEQLKEFDDFVFDNEK